jgi:hypothetical protein
MNPKLCRRKCFMKKFALCTMLLLFLLGTAGCNKEEKFITADEVTTDIYLLKQMVYFR